MKNATSRFSTRVVTFEMSTMINRMLATYCLVAPVAGIVAMISQIPNAPVWWSAIFAGGICLAVVAMFVQAFAARSIRAAAGVFALLTLVAMATAPFVLPPIPANGQSWLWWLLGQAVVAAGISGGSRVGVGYGIAAGMAYGLLQHAPAGGGSSMTTAVSLALFGPVAGLAILAVAMGMLRAARVADARRARVIAQQAEVATLGALARERERLDRLIHDDVMTTLTAATHAEQPEAVEATATLAAECLAKIGDMRRDLEPPGPITATSFEALVGGTARQVGAQVVAKFTRPPAAPAAGIGADAAEVLLGAVREALRNAVRHSGATKISVHCTIQASPAGAQVTLAVEDDGSGFDPDQVGPARMGLQLSVREPVERIGGSVAIDSAPHRGTRVVLRWAGDDAAVGQEPVRAAIGGTEALPAEFPVGELIAVMWLVYAVEVVIGLLNVRDLHPAWLIWPAIIAMAGLNAVLLRRGAQLRLPTVSGVTVVSLLAVVTALMAVAAPRDHWPLASDWHWFPLQLVLVALVLRRRAGLAFAALGVLLGVDAVWCFVTGMGWPGLLKAGFGPVCFVVLAFFTRLALHAISVRQQALEQAELATLEEVAGRRVASVQRRLWLIDLDRSASATLEGIAAARDHIPPLLRTEAQLIEAALRESLVARNVMSDELIVLTGEARRRGVAVTVVDSRATPVSAGLLGPVTAAVRRALQSEALSKVVIRFGSERRGESASVMTVDDGEISLATMIDGGVAEPNRRVGAGNGRDHR